MTSIKPQKICVDCEHHYAQAEYTEVGSHYVGQSDYCSRREGEHSLIDGTKIDPRSTRLFCRDERRRYSRNDYTGQCGHDGLYFVPKTGKVRK